MPQNRLIKKNREIIVKITGQLKESNPKENSPRRHRDVIYHDVIIGKAFTRNSVIFSAVEITNLALNSYKAS